MFKSFVQFALALCVGGASGSGAALAQSPSPQIVKPSHCIALARNTPGVEYLRTASMGDPLDRHTLRLTYLTHASFLLETPEGVSAVTDFTGITGRAGFLPDIVTMNHAHATHWTPNVHPDILYVLRGWGEVFGEGISHYITVKDLVVRNVSTDIRSGGGVEPKGNSIFVFEVAGLCVGHLGHIHHEPSPAQYAALGRLDVVMAPVDGGRTLDTETIARVLNRLRSSVVVPMHWFGITSLQRFLNAMEGSFAIDLVEAPSLELSLLSLPRQPTIKVLRPQFFEFPD